MQEGRDKRSAAGPSRSHIMGSSVSHRKELAFSPQVVGGLSSRKSDWKGLNYVPQKGYIVVQPLVPRNVTLFGDRVFTEVIKLKQSH